MAEAVECLTKTLPHFTAKDYAIGSNHFIRVTHITNPDNFYVRPLVYEKYMEEIQARGDHATGEDAVYKATVIFKAETVNQYVRGRIEMIDDKKNVYSIFAVDHGFFETNVLLENIYKPKTQFWPDSLALQCQLAFCAPLQGTWDEKAIDAMKYYVANDEPTRMIIEGVLRDMYIVELVTSCGPPDVATLMVFAGVSALGYGTNAVNRLTVAPKAEKNYYNYKQFKVGDRIHVRTINGKSLEKFYVADVKDYIDYKEARGDFLYASKKASSVSDTDLREELPVSCYSFGYNTYERGVVISVGPGRFGPKAVVQCVDTGDVVEGTRRILSKMPERFMSRAPTAIYCKTEDSQDFDSRLRILHPGAEFMITIVEVGYRFSKPNLVKIEFDLNKRV